MEIPKLNGKPEKPIEQQNGNSREIINRPDWKTRC